MGINLNEIRDPKTRAAAIEQDRIQNAAYHALGKLAPAKQERHKVQPLDGGGKLRKQSSGGVAVVISLIAFRHREIDDDACIYSLVPLRDAIAASLGLDDADKRIKFQYSQVVTRGNEGVLVAIESLK